MRGTGNIALALDDMIRRAGHSVMDTPCTVTPETADVLKRITYIFAVGDPNSRDHREDRTGDANLLLNLIRGVEPDIRDNTYNADVARNLPYGKRTGVIARRAYYDIFPEKRSAFRKGLTDEELASLARYAETDHIGILPSCEYSPWMVYIPEIFTDAEDYFK